MSASCVADASQHPQHSSSSLSHLVAIDDDRDDDDDDDDDGDDTAAPAAPPPPPPILLAYTEIRSEGFSLKQHDDDLLQLFDWVTKFLAVCVGAIGAVGQVLLDSSHQSQPLPIIFHLACFAVVLGFAALFTARNLPRTTAERYVRVLVHVGQLSAVTAFVLTMTILFPPYLKFASYAIYFASLLAVALHCFHFTGNAEG